MSHAPLVTVAILTFLLLHTIPVARAQQFSSHVLTGSVRDPDGLIAADLDGDGAIELVIAAANQSVLGHVAIQKRTSTGTWAQVAVWSTGRVAGTRSPRPACSSFATSAAVSSPRLS